MSDPPPTDRTADASEPGDADTPGAAEATDAPADDATETDGAPAADGAGESGPGPTPLADEAVLAVETAAPDGEEPAARCDRCGRPFRDERALALHRGELHGGLTDEEVAAYEEAREAERDELFFFHIRVVVALGILYALSIVAYMVVFSS